MEIRRLTGKAGLLAVFVATLLWLVSGGIASAAVNAQSGSDAESNLPFLFALYTITWLAFFAYAFYMTRRQSELNREIQELRRMLEQREQSDA